MKRTLTKIALMATVLVIMLSFTIGASASPSVDLSDYGLKDVSALYDPAALTTESLAALKIQENCATVSLNNGFIKLKPIANAADNFHAVSNLGLAAGEFYNLNADALVVRIKNSGNEEYGLLFQLRDQGGNGKEVTVRWSDAYTLYNLAGDEVEFEQYYDKISVPAGFDGYIVIDLSCVQAVISGNWAPLYRDGANYYVDEALTERYLTFSLESIIQIIMYNAGRDGNAVAKFGAGAELQIGGMYTANFGPLPSDSAGPTKTAAPTKAPDDDNPGTGAPLLLIPAIASVISAAVVLRKKNSI